MPDSFIEVSEGSGKKLASFERTVNSETVQDQRVVAAEPYLAAYTVSVTTAVSVATANSHLLQIMAGANKRLLLRRLVVTQAVSAGAETRCVLQLLRLTTAGTGGTAITPPQLDPADSNAEAAAMTLPSSKGDEGSILWVGATTIPDTLPTSEADRPLLDLSWPDPMTKGPTIAAGTSNGLALKNITAVASATVHIYAEFAEDAS